MTQEDTTMDQPEALSNEDAFWGTPSPVAPAEGEGKSHRRQWLAAAVGAAVIAVAAVVGVNLTRSETQSIGAAAGPGGGGPGGFGGPRGGPGGGEAGTIDSIDGSKLTMTTPAGTTVTVLTNGSTTVTATTPGSLADVHVGDNVFVTGAASGTTVTAEQVTDSGTTPAADGPRGQAGPPPNGANRANGRTAPAPNSAAPNANNQANPNRPPDGNGPPPGRDGFGRPVAGVVKSLNGTSFAVTANDGTVYTVDTSSSTSFNAQKPSSVSALKVGDQIRVSGATASDGTITATFIRVGDTGGRPRQAQP